jgi:hypothetical protein
MNIRRFKNQIECLKKVRKIVEDEDLTMKQVNFKALFPLLEGISLEEDESLQNRWANLFTNYIDFTKNLLLHVYPEILRQLSSEEVGILKNMQRNRNWIRILERNFEVDNLNKNFAYFDQIGNLRRLGILEEVLRFESEFSKSSSYSIKTPGKGDGEVKQLPSIYYRITDFGQQFLEACSR